MSGDARVREAVREALPVDIRPDIDDETIDRALRADKGSVGARSLHLVASAVATPRGAQERVSGSRLERSFRSCMHSHDDGVRAATCPRSGSPDA
jgi:hypothetical protein